MAKTLHTVDQVFDELGGIQSIIELTGAKYNRVHNWRAFGRFPANSYRAIKEALAAKGLDADEALWPEMLEPRMPLCG